MVGLAFHRRNRLLVQELREGNNNNITNTTSTSNNNNITTSSSSSCNNDTTVMTKLQHQHPKKGRSMSSSSKNDGSQSSSTSFLARKGFTFAIFIALISIKQNWESIQILLWPNGIASSTPLQYTFLMQSPRNNTALQFHHGNTYIIQENAKEDTDTEPLLFGPETILWDKNHDKLYIANPFGQLVQISNLQYPSPSKDHDTTAKDRYVIKADTTVFKDLGNGRPLGGQFTKEKDGTTTLYIADGVSGLLRIRNFYNSDPSKSTVEIVASKVIDPDTKMVTPIHFADDVAIGPKNGKVYFTDATNIPLRKVVRQRKNHHPTDGSTSTNTRYEWDLIYPSIQECLRGGNGTGRLLQYDPISNEVTVLVKNLGFANGITILDKDETALLIVETCRMQVQKYYLMGPKKGTIETVIYMNQLPGFLDGIDCSFETGICYGAIMNEVSPIQKFQKLLPGSIEPYLRTFSLWLARYIDIPIQPYGGFIIIKPTTIPPYTIEQFVLDPTGQDISGVTGVTYYKNKLYLGSLHNHYIGVYDLSNLQQKTTKE